MEFSASDPLICTVECVGARILGAGRMVLLNFMGASIFFDFLERAIVSTGRMVHLKFMGSTRIERTRKFFNSFRASIECASKFFNSVVVQRYSSIKCASIVFNSMATSIVVNRMATSIVSTGKLVVKHSPAQLLRVCAAFI